AGAGCCKESKLVAAIQNRMHDETSITRPRLRAALPRRMGKTPPPHRRCAEHDLSGAASACSGQRQERPRRVGATAKTPSARRRGDENTFGSTALRRKRPQRCREPALRAPPKATSAQRRRPTTAPAPPTPL